MLQETTVFCKFLLEVQKLTTLSPWQTNDVDVSPSDVFYLRQESLPSELSLAYSEGRASELVSVWGVSGDWSWRDIKIWDIEIMLNYIHILSDDKTKSEYTYTHTHVCVCMCAQSCLTLCDSRDGSPPGSSVHGIFQARVLEWVATSYSRRSSQPRDRTHVSCISCTGRWVLYHWATWGNPYIDPHIN